MSGVSVVLCTWNNCRRLAVTLDAVTRCRIPPGLRWELVLVNNNCTDRTPEVAAGFAGRLPLVYVEEPRQGLSRAKNAGIAAASGELFVFTDDDVRPCRDWIRLYWEAYRELGSRYYFGGPLRCEYEGGELPDDRLLRLASAAIAGFNLGRERRPLGAGEHFMEANWACPAEAVRRAGGYDVRLGLDPSLGRRRVGEGFDLIDRLNELGMSSLYLPEAYVFHFVPRAKCTLRHIAENARAHGVCSLRARTTWYFLARRPWLRGWLGGEKWTVSALCRLGAVTVLLTLRWAAARLAGKDGYDEHVSLQFCLGRLEGYRDALGSVWTAVAGPRSSACDKKMRGRS